MHHVAASIYLDQLSISEDQKSDMKKLHSKNQAINLMYTKETHMIHALYIENTMRWGV